MESNSQAQQELQQIERQVALIEAAPGQNAETHRQYDLVGALHDSFDALPPLCHAARGFDCRIGRTVVRSRLSRHAAHCRRIPGRGAPRAIADFETGIKPRAQRDPMINWPRGRRSSK